MRALFIGRFQPVHEGHRWAIEKILGEDDTLAIVIGSAQESGTKENPFSSAERKKMLRSILPKGANIRLFEVPDIPDDDSYADHVRNKVGDFDVVWSGNKRVQDIFFQAGFQIKELPKYKHIHATEIRKRLRTHRDVSGLVPAAVIEIIKNAGTKKEISQ
ncbi:MAG: adenylyltransferase/cytidyltransferase family protein [Nanoarchaeota archaeon]